MIRKFSRERRTPRGFTIVELAVVVAVIGILISILVFSAQRVQMAARDTKRDSDMRIFVAALDRYYEQNGDYPSAEYESIYWMQGINISAETSSWQDIAPSSLVMNTWTDPTVYALQQVLTNGEIPSEFGDPLLASNNLLFDYGTSAYYKYPRYEYWGGGIVKESWGAYTSAGGHNTYGFRDGTSATCGVSWTITTADRGKALAPSVTRYSEVDDKMYVYTLKYGIKPTWNVDPEYAACAPKTKVVTY